MSDDGRRSRRQRSVIAATKNSEDTMRTCVGAAPYRSTPAEDLCFNNYCDIAARVRKANQCRCVRGPHGDADGRTRPTDRSTDREPRDKRARGSGPRREEEGPRGREKAPRGLFRWGVAPLRQDGLLAFLHHRPQPRLSALASSLPSSPFRLVR